MGVVIPTLPLISISFGTLKAQIDIAIAALLAELSARIEGMGDLALNIGLTLPGADVAIVGELMNLLISGAYTPPSLDANLGLIDGLKIELELIKAAIEKTLEYALDLGKLIIELDELCAADGIRLFVFDGLPGEFGNQSNSNIANGGNIGPQGQAASLDPGTPVFALMLMTEKDSPAKVVLEKFFKTIALLYFAILKNHIHHLALDFTLDCNGRPLG